MASTNLFYYNPAAIETTNRKLETDICIYGGNAAGIVAAVQAARLGMRAVVLEPGSELGGLTTGGLSCTDAGKKHTIGGLSLEFYRRCGEHYGIDAEWRFEPHVATKVLQEMLDESGVPIYYRQFLSSIEISDGRIAAIGLEGGLQVRARAFIDCSYEGDLMARAGVSYHVGRESNAVYNETLNGVQVMRGHQFMLPVDPYNVPGDPTSGLLPGIDPAPLGETGSGDRRVQAYNFRLCLSNDPANRLPFEKPENYDEREYELAARYLAAGFDQPLAHMVGKLRGSKIDMNNRGAVSSDFIGRNYEYPEADYWQREEIFQAHVTYQKGLMWFWANDSRVPQSIRESIEPWGLAADEFTATGGWPHQLYVREARRMVADYVMTEHNCAGRETIEDSIGMASYTMDSHNTRRFVRDGQVFNEGNVEVGVQPFAVSLRSIYPRRGECENLLVPVCLSASHIAYGSIRMEPVFMILGQSAATVAALAIEKGCAVQDIEYQELRTQLERDEQILEESANLSQVAVV